ncbi:MAG: HEAT repeat domain-containing protein [Polyangiaceae bacterium]|nr:HEAT repeat domain-containing protein [Polyangiaceae bacterium]
MTRSARHAWTWSWLGLGLALSDIGLAQPPVQRLPLPGLVRPGPAAARPGTPEPEPASLRTLVGIEVAQAWLRSSDADERRRALMRLGELGTAQAIELLARAVDTGGAAHTAPEYFSAARVLSRHASRPSARQALVRLMSGAGAERLAVPAEQRLVRRTAALGLAAYGRAEGQRRLGRALREPGPLAEAASQALLAHPPELLEPVLTAPGPATLELVALLEALGDQRAFSWLRNLVVTSEPELRARAAVALTRLGDLETVPLAQRWSAAGQDAVLRVAGARILALTHARGWQRALGALLDDDATRDAALALAAEAGHPALGGSLVRCLALASSADQAERILTALSRAGGSASVQALSSKLEDPRLGSSAAYALALASDGQATSVLERALGRPAVAPRAARAAVIRHSMLGESTEGLPAALERLLASPLPARRAAGAWGLATLQPQRLGNLLRSSDPVIVRAAARALTQARSEARMAAADRLGTETDRVTREALALVLVHADAAARVSTRLLGDLVDAGGPAAPLATFRLVARRDAEIDQVVMPLLTSPDALWRAHAALGLGHRREPRAVGLLEEAYVRETDDSVRRAIVTALGCHARAVPFGTLGTAMLLDPDPGTRQAARLAAQGRSWRELAELDSGPASLWLELVASKKSDTVAYPPTIVRTTSGLALPMVPDPDGLITALGLTVGPIELRLVPDSSTRRSPTSQGQ